MAGDATAAKTGRNIDQSLASKPWFISPTTSERFKQKALTDDELKAAIAANVLNATLVGRGVPELKGMLEGDREAEMRRFDDLIARLRVQRPEIAYPSAIATGAVSGLGLGGLGKYVSEMWLRTRLS